VLVEVAAVAPRSLRDMGPPLGAMLGVTILLSGVLWFFNRKRPAELPEQENPAELKSALVFGALYALVLLAVAFARERFGTAGLYTVAAISGLTDVDAITLSTSRLVEGAGLDVRTGWRTILLASMSNLVFKAGIVAVLGGGRLFLRVALLFSVALAAGAAILWLWP
jgi:uncharacterized membrane protein (DUF4010 family)